MDSERPLHDTAHRVNVDTELAELVTLHRRPRSTVVDLDVELTPPPVIKGEVGVKLRQQHPVRRPDSPSLVPPTSRGSSKVYPLIPPHVKTVNKAICGDFKYLDDPVYYVEQSVRRLKLNDEVDNSSHPRQSAKVSSISGANPTSGAARLQSTTVVASAPAGSVSASVNLGSQTGYALWPSDSEVSEDEKETRAKKYYVIAQGRHPGVYDSWYFCLRLFAFQLTKIFEFRRDASPQVTGVKNNLHKSYTGKKKAERMYRKCEERGIVKVRK